jgi:hypothetical protein
MNNAAKFIIAALVIIAGVFMFQTYKSGGFENMQSIPATQDADVEAH